MLQPSFAVACPSPSWAIYYYCYETFIVVIQSKVFVFFCSVFILEIYKSSFLYSRSAWNLIKLLMNCISLFWFAVVWIEWNCTYYMFILYLFSFLFNVQTSYDVQSNITWQIGSVFKNCFSTGWFILKYSYLKRSGETTHARNASIFVRHTFLTMGKMIHVIKNYFQ